MQSVNTAQIAQEPAPAKEAWSLIRTAENATASSVVSLVQYTALEKLIKQESVLLRHEIRSSESRMVNWLRGPLQAMVDKLINAPRQYSSVDAKDFDEIGRNMP